MHTLLTVDPGSDQIDYAVFCETKLVAVGVLYGSLHSLSRQLGAMLAHHKPDQVVVEVPQIYQPRLQHGDQNDLIDVAIITGLVVASASKHCTAEIVHPHTWKGNRPKNIDNVLTMLILSLTEQSVIHNCGVKKSKLHNILDAVGIGLRTLNRSNNLNLDKCIK